MRILGIDPGEHCGFAVTEGDSIRTTMKVLRTPIMWMGATIEQAQAYIEVHGMPDVVLIEDQYKGKASLASTLTLAQRSGYIVGALKVPPERVYYVQPNPWYKAIGMPPKCTKQVCMYRIQANLSSKERAMFEALCAQHPERRLDIAAAVGISWSWPNLPAASKKRKFQVFKIAPKRAKRSRPR